VNAAAWVYERKHGAVGALHGLEVPSPARRLVWELDAAADALVIGSAQHLSDEAARACEDAGVEVVKRHSGGGAVLVRPGEIVWLDVILPRSDPLWDDDIGRSFWWLGEAWQRALRSTGIESVVHRGAMVRTSSSDRVCFAGLGPGEVVCGDAKVVGISQRRTRDWARFQCALHRRWDVDAYARLLAAPDLRHDLAGAAMCVDPSVDVAHALRRALADVDP